MTPRNLLLCLVAAAALGAGAPVLARTNVDIIVNVAPPPVRVERVPVPRVGFVWVPGYWDYRGHKHHWIRGAWVRERPGYYYHPHRWVEVDGRWHMRPGAWSHDRDGDGVPNRFDRRPDNPYRH